MKKTRLRDIKKAIGWQNNCRTYFTKYGVPYAYYNPNFGVEHGNSGHFGPLIHIPRHKDAEKSINHCFLHECLHHLIEQKLGTQHVNKTLYLREYRIEKQVRKYARLFNWHDILNSSNDWVKKNMNIKPKNKYENAYFYAAKRIAREEKINES